MATHWRSSGGDESAAGVTDNSMEERDSSQPMESYSTAAALSSTLEQDEADSSSMSANTPYSSKFAKSTRQQSHGSLADSAQDSGDPPYRSVSSSLQQSLQRQNQPLDGGSGDDLDDDHSQAMQSNSSDTNEPQITDDEDGSDHEVPWKPQATQSTCEFTHKIINYSQKRESGCKKAEYSSTTVDEFGNRWRLIVYVNGNGRASNHHLSLFLQVADADDLPFGWKKAVSYVLTLEHPSEQNLSYAKRNPDKTFKLCPKAIDWGWSQFITSDRIQQEGFVQNDTLVVRASVTVKSSSVAIDLDDAELYLKCAVEEGKPEAVQLCLDQGASVNCQFKDDLYTPLHTACSSSTSDDSSSDASSNNNNEENMGSMQVLQLLLEKGADGNACNKWRETPLLIAANNGHRAAVEALLKHGADPSLCSEAGWSALTFAAHKGYDDIVSLLLNAGAPVNCRVTEDSSTPLHKSCAGSKSGHLTAVKLLLDNGADVHALNKWRETPLLTAANHGQAGAVEALLNVGADPCKCTDTGWSPLSIAAYKGHDDVVKLLLDEGNAPTEEADPTLSALLQAATKGLPDTVKLLLRHGADHTVTTKKGDTALSILVEQNLIDAAVDMVRDYNASIPRCSRDRKKVQRARLLINHRVKQLEKEGINAGEVEDDESDLEDNRESAVPQPNGNEEKQAPISNQKKKNKKKKKKKMSAAEQQAKAAEEALLLELEQEDAQKQKEEEEANKKSAKKRKKKERERQQKKEQEERRLAEEREREEKLRKEKEAKEAAERAERERLAAIRREQEEAERRKRQQELMKKKEKEKKEQEQRLKVQRQKAQEKAANAQKSSPPQNEKRGKSERAKPNQQTHLQTAVVSNRQNGSTPPVSTSPSASDRPVDEKSRGWEIKPMNSSQERKESPLTLKSGLQVNGKPIVSDLFGVAQPEASSPFPGQKFSGPSQGQNPFASSKNGLNGISPSSQFAAQKMEHPAISTFRRDKVKEIFRRRSLSDPLVVVDEATVKTVIYRWMVRAAIQPSAYLDCVIPSWVDSAELTTFFQRQFIAESRKKADYTMRGMESLKEAGSALAILCFSLAKDVVEYKNSIERQLPSDWNDSTVGMNVRDVMSNGGGSMVVIDWAKRSEVLLPSMQFSRLRDHYFGPTSRFLTALFNTKMRYETKKLLLADTTMDCSLPPNTLSVLSTQGLLSGQAWSDPFSSSGSSIYWGQFPDVDSYFGGLMPFGRGGEESILNGRAISISIMVPLDSMISSTYLKRMVDLMFSPQNVPISFAVFFRSDCFLDSNGVPTIDDVYALDPRLRDNNFVVRRVEQLAPGKHHYYSETSGTLKVSLSGSLFVLLQNETGRTTFDFGESSISEIIRSMGGGMQLQANAPLSYAPNGLLLNDNTGLSSAGGYFDVRPPPVSPIQQQQQQQQQMSTDFGPVGGANLTSNFAAPGSGQRGSRLLGFLGSGLVDDGEEDHLNDVDVVSGMLGNLDMDLFQNPMGQSAQDIDIEAISLMGIGKPPSGSRLQPRGSRAPFG